MSFDYAGILLTDKTVSVMFAQGSDDPRTLAPSTIPTESWPVGNDPAESLSRAGHYIVERCPSVKRVGLGSFGPLDAIPEVGSGAMVLGRVTRMSRHVNLRQLEVLRIVEASLPKGVRVRVWTDVMCGAVAESLDRQSKSGVVDYVPTSRDDVIFFLHVSTGVGGTFARYGNPWQGAQHSEVGYTCAQIVAGDDYAASVWQRYGGRAPVYVEDLIEEEALLARTGKRHIDDIASDDPMWGIVAEYVAQVCQMAMVVVAPHRIVLHGRVLERPDVGLLDKVRRAFNGWVARERRIPVYYDEMKDPGVFIDRPLSAEPMLRGAVMLAAMP